MFFDKRLSAFRQKPEHSLAPAGGRSLDAGDFCHHIRT
jgi:hypothetical protein